MDNGMRLHIAKLLSIYSPVFSSLFLGDFRESRLQEVAIEDVEPEQFEQLLQVRYAVRFLSFSQTNLLEEEQIGARGRPGRLAGRNLCSSTCELGL